MNPRNDAPKIGEASASRREFLSGLALAGCSAAMPAFAGCGPPARRTDQRAPWRAEQEDPGDEVEVLDRAILLRSGDRLENRSFAVSPDFDAKGAGGVIVVAGDDVRIRNVRIAGASEWDPRWEDPRRRGSSLLGVHSRTFGIFVRDVRDVAVESVSIEGLPRAAILGYRVEGALFRDIDVRHCYHGIQFIPKGPSRRIHVAEVRGGDFWGPQPGAVKANQKTGHPSLKRPGSWIGGDALALNTLRDSLVEDCTASGEMFGAFKMTNPQSVEVRGMRGPNIMIQGTADQKWRIHESPARDVWIHDCVFDKGLAHGAAVQRGNCIQVSQNVESVLIERCILDGAGKDGHAIQFSLNAHGRVVDCTIRNFNGRRGRNRAHAVDLARNSSVNDDFERVNRFIDQRRIRLDRNRRQPESR